MTPSLRRSVITQSDLATALGRPRSYVSKFETGERRLDVVEFIAVAEAIGIDPARFVRDLRGRLATGARKPAR